MISIPKHLVERARLIIDTTYFPIPQHPVLTAIACIEKDRIQVLAEPDSLFYRDEVRKFTDRLQAYGLTSDLAVEEYLSQVEATIVSYRQRLKTLEIQYAKQQQECYAAFEREEDLRFKIAAVKVSI
jgi:hypothetical protein